MFDLHKFVSIKCSCFFQKKMYFMCESFNALFCLDTTTNCIRFVAEIEGEESNERNLYFDMKLYNNKLIMTPLNAKSILIFDINSEKTEKISLDEIRINTETFYYNQYTRAKLITSVLIDSKLYFIAWRYPAIVELDLETLKIKYYTEWVEELSKFKINNFAYFMEDVVVKNNNIFCKSINSEAVLKFNVSDKKSYIINKENFMDADYENITDFEKDILLSSIKETDSAGISIPDDWKKIIYKSDGTRKKIIFYNTSISALLNDLSENNDGYFNKLNNTFDLFKKNADNVVLLWRPHPLMENTIKSMRSKLLNEYMDIVNEYKLAGWGIYDDTADLNRAIAISDAYYGDFSSVVQLYEKTGKPIMIQNYNVLS